MTNVLALDIGGTKIAAGLVGDDGTVRLDREVPTDQTSPDAVAAALEGLVGGVLTAAREQDLEVADVVGVGSAGPVDAGRGTVDPVNIVSLRGFPLVEHVARAASRVLGREVSAALAQDGQCFAAAEQWIGAARGSRSMMGVVVSTGIGGGIVLEGRILAGKSGNAGFLSHVGVVLDGELLPGSGALGVVEAYASGPAMVRAALAQGWRHGERVDARVLTADARAGDPVATAVIAAGTRALASAFLSTAALLDLEDVVVGGGVASAGDVLLDPLRRAYAELAVYPHLADVRISASQLPRGSGLVGAGRLGWQRLGA
ncbi:ROK family protein [Kineococcus radiotolerans]|uniref:ROK family protein n=1 Tax=Kineococcus radiotolerans (strain ATCC BAA-149 / DSM 14245 / SRS30216) TaxID=266940 RepID=A6W6X0_KINRD|nr:ROK family protein [Kineococcus radiotolerans]ABS02559.1 ROK family protein [Kineococcus radiotolerans SRS30216 = ATCC BAA-149]